MKFKKEVVIVSVIVIVLVLILSNFFPMPRFARSCGDCTGWVDKECGGSAGVLECSSLEMLQKRTCMPVAEDIGIWFPTGEDGIPLSSPKRETPEELSILINEEQKEEQEEKSDKEIEELEIEESENTEESNEDINLDISSTESSSHSTRVDKQRSIPPSCTARCIPMPEVCNTPPNEPFNPTPQDLEEGVEIETQLSWESNDQDNQELNYDIYFGTTDSPELVESEHHQTNYMLPQLNYSSNYFWMITADDGHNETNSSIWMFTTREEPNYPPQEPSNPIPENGANDTTITLVLYWTSSDQNDDDLTYDLYFGKETLELISENQTETNYTTIQLNYSTTYFWRIVVDDGINETNGTTWNFTTGVLPNNPPNQPTNMDPVNGSTNVPTNIVLTWSGEDPDGDTLSYDVYFSTNFNPILVSTSQTEEYFIQELNYSTTYFWKVVSIDEHSATNDSEIFTFTTREEELPLADSNPGPYALFDVKVELHEDTNIAYPGGDIYADIILYNMGTISPVDVILDCTLEDMERNVFDYFQETLMVESQTKIERKMTMPESSEIGNYVFSCVLTYAEEVAVSQDLFRIIEQDIHEEEPAINYDVYKLILISLLVLTVLLFAKVKKKRKRRKKRK